MVRREIGDSEYTLVVGEDPERSHIMIGRNELMNLIRKYLDSSTRPPKLQIICTTTFLYAVLRKKLRDEAEAAKEKQQ